MAVEGLGGGSNGIAFLVSAGVAYEIIAASCSSPQTTELNAAARSETLMKWVNIGMAQTLLFVGLAALFDRPHATAIVAGGVLAVILLYVQYAHAKQSGLENGGPPTESYGAEGTGGPQTQVILTDVAAAGVAGGLGV